jgi:CRISPR/Cas system-associated protein Cas10 (large subunit of type III CRISPR-Cas system)
LQIVHDNTVQFYKWDQSDVDHFAEQVRVYLSDEPLTRSKYIKSSVHHDILDLREVRDKVDKKKASEQAKRLAKKSGGK